MKSLGNNNIEIISPKVKIERAVEILIKEDVVLMKRVISNVEIVTFPFDGISRMLLLTNRFVDEKKQVISKFSCQEINTSKLNCVREIEDAHAVSFASLVKKNSVVIQCVGFTMREEIQHGLPFLDVLKIVPVIKGRDFELVLTKRIKFHEYYKSPFHVVSFVNCENYDLVLSCNKRVEWSYEGNFGEGEFFEVSFLVLQDCEMSFREEEMIKRKGNEKNELKGITIIKTKYHSNVSVSPIQYFVKPKTEKDSIIYWGCNEQKETPIHAKLIKVKLRTSEILEYDIKPEYFPQNEGRNKYLCLFKSVETYFSERQGKEKVVAWIRGKVRSSTHYNLWVKKCFIGVWKLTGQLERIIEPSQKKVRCVFYAGSSCLLLGGKEGGVFSINTERAFNMKKELDLESPNWEYVEDSQIKSMDFISYSQNERSLRFLICSKTDKCIILRVEGVDYPQCFLRSNVEMDLFGRIEFLKEYEGNFKIFMKNCEPLIVFRSLLL